MIVARGLIAGREEHWQVITGRRLAIECIGIQSIQRKLQGGISRRREHGPAIEGGRYGRGQGCLTGGHVHGCVRVWRHRRHDRHGRIWKSLVAGHARDVPSQISGHPGHWQTFVKHADTIYFLYIFHTFLIVMFYKKWGIWWKPIQFRAEPR